MKFNICVPIPIKTGNINEIKPIINKALKTNPDLIELRFDYIDRIKNITSNFGKNLLNLIQPKIQTIFTFRAPSEGGQMKIEKNDHFLVLKKLIEAQPSYLDIEMNTDNHILGEIIFFANKNGVKLFFSYHDFKKTPSYEEGFRLIENFQEKLISKLLIDSKIVEKSVYKLIFTARTFEDNLIPLKLCKTFSEKGNMIICFCMGELGIFSRVMCLKVGSFLTFGSLEEKTAPGQIHVEKIRKFHQFL